MREKWQKSLLFRIRASVYVVNISQNYLRFSLQHLSLVFLGLVQSAVVESASLFSSLYCLQQPDMQQPPAASLALEKERNERNDDIYN